MKNLYELLKHARFVFVCGNGGSAATAEHFTIDLFSKGIKAICLNSNTAIMTMIANDFGYDQVFSRQLDIYARKKDLLITISCSGTSQNIVRAIRKAKIIGLKTYEFETFGKKRDFGELENRHLQVVHMITKQL